MALWEQILLGILAVVITILFLPGIRERLKNSPKGSTEDWLGLLKPILVVIFFVVLLVALS